jgi:hypothetical protein
MPPLQTPSGRPEVTIYDITKKKVVDAIVNASLEKGAQIKQINEYSVIIGIRDKSFLSSLLYGSRYDSTPEIRASFNLVEIANGIRVFCNATMVTNPGSAFERISDVTTGKNAHDIQSMLERLKAQLETYRYIREIE